MSANFRQVVRVAALTVAIAVMFSLSGCASSPTTSSDAEATRASGSNAKIQWIAPPLGNSDRAPAIDISRKTAPRYPLVALKEHHQGTVVLGVTIDARGQIVSVAVERSSGYPELDQSAVDAAETWRFLPGYHEGRPVGGIILTPVNFALPPHY